MGAIANIGWGRPPGYLKVRWPPGNGIDDMDQLRTVKLIHTVIWVFFAACIFAIPVFTVLSKLRIAEILAAIVALEVGVLLLNGLTCPLTDVAARYTDDRRANFDIYLPEWLARNNKTIFGALYVASLLHLFVAWRALK